jgi:hypothetical protein
VYLDITVSRSLAAPFKYQGRWAQNSISLSNQTRNETKCKGAGHLISRHSQRVETEGNFGGQMWARKGNGVNNDGILNLE